MSCCEPQNRKAFLESKLTNFRAFLEPHCTTEALKERLLQFRDLDSVLPYLSQLVALKKLGHLDAAVETFCAYFPATASDETFRIKVKRYIAMFIDVTSSA